MPYLEKYPLLYGLRHFLHSIKPICRYFLHKQKSTTIKDIKQLLDTLPILDLQALKNHYEEKLSIMGINLT